MFHVLQMRKGPGLAPDPDVVSNPEVEIVSLLTLLCFVVEIQRTGSVYQGNLEKRPVSKTVQEAEFLLAHGLCLFPPLRSSLNVNWPFI